MQIVSKSAEIPRFTPGSKDPPSRGRGTHFGSEEDITDTNKELGPVELHGSTKLSMIHHAKSMQEKITKKHGMVFTCEHDVSSCPCELT